MWKVVVFQSTNQVVFEFNNLADALEFAGTCLETCMDEDATEIIIRKKQEE